MGTLSWPGAVALLYPGGAAAGGGTIFKKAPGALPRLWLAGRSHAPSAALSLRAQHPLQLQAEESASPAGAVLTCTIGGEVCAAIPCVGALVACAFRGRLASFTFREAPPGGPPGLQPAVTLAFLHDTAAGARELQAALREAVALKQPDAGDTRIEAMILAALEDPAFEAYVGDVERVWARVEEEALGG